MKTAKQLIEDKVKEDFKFDPHTMHIQHGIFNAIQTAIAHMQGAMNNAIRDIIHIDNVNDQRATANVFKDILELEIKEYQHHLDGIKKQYKL
jgi:hypothetical protein